jgi:DHA1 family bicyclomycin/chloramphenicol resistance-like MFS transporter
MFIGRFLQGVGIAAPAILSFLIIADSYSLKEQQYWMAMLNGIMNMSVGAAPVLGSYITLYFDWQGNFVALLFLGLLALGMTIFFIPHYKLSVHKEPLSLSGFIPLFQSKPLMLLSMTMVFIFLPYWIFSGISPVLYMEGLGVSLSHFGYYQGVLAIGFALGSVGLGLLIKKHDQKTILSFSNPLFILSLMVMCVITIIDTKSPLLITLALTLFVTAQIIPSTLLYPVCLNFIPRAKGRISAIIQGARLILSVFFLQMAGYFYQGSFQNVGIMLSLLMIPIIIALYMVLKNRELMQFAEKN